MPCQGIYYAIHPGLITSENDKEKHFVGVVDLLNLYGLQRHEAIVWDEVSNPEISKKIKYDSLIHLYPRDDCRYFKIPRTTKQQMDLWLRDISMHVIGDGLDECCPDFSCCYPLNENTPKKAKMRFKVAYDEQDGVVMYNMINMFITNSYLTTNPEQVINIRGHINAKIH